jgi:PAS domain S-box-containing protein
MRDDVVGPEAGERLRADAVALVDALDAVPDGFLSFDKDWRITHVNAAAERISGLPRDALLGRTGCSAFPGALATPFEEVLRRAMHYRVVIRGEHHYPPLERWFEIEARPIAGGGLAVHLRDTTLRLAAEREARRLSRERDELLARLQHQFERLPLACVVTDRRLRIIDWNPAAERVFGYRRDEAIGRAGDELLLSPEALVALAEQLAGLRRGAIIEHSVVENVARDGRVILCEWHNTPLRDGDGRMIGVLAMADDITARMAAERELRASQAKLASELAEMARLQRDREQLLDSERRARAEAERAARLKDDFLATLSHELRTPLSAITAWSDLIRMAPHDVARVSRGAEIIGRNARAQSQLVGDLLDLSRISSGKMRLDVHRVDLPAVVEVAVEAVRPAAEARSIQLHLAIEPPTGSVHGDASRLQQIVWNLVSNAVKFTPEGGRVRVDVASVGSQVEIRVSDTGKGITAGFLPHVFERFRQADPSAAREHGGLGIGLALVKELTELHGGSVAASSEGEGRGATFSVALPLATITTEADGSVRLHPRVPAALSLADLGGLQLAGIRVLVVDDEADGLEVIQQILADSEAEVTAARSVDEALDALDRETFDVLLSDIGMPRRDGYELIAEVRKRGLAMPAAAVTAFVRSEDRTRALLSGFQAHLAKPLEASELLAVVASLAGRLGREPKVVP